MRTKTKFLAMFGFVMVLGILAVPLSSYAQEERKASGAVEISFGIAETLSMKVTGGGHVEGSEETFLSMENNDISTVEHGIEIATNNMHGYKLSMKDSDDNNNLTREDGRYHIPAVVNTVGEGDVIEGAELVKGESGWGYDVKLPLAEPDYSGTYLAVPVDWVTIYNHDDSGDPAKTEINVANFSETTYVKFGISAGNSRAGTYEDTIEYQVVGNLVPDNLKSE